jgi:hypothetical protein
MNKRCFTSFKSRGAVFPLKRPTLEPYSVMAVDVPGMVAKFMESHDDTDMVCEMRSL